MTTLTLDVKPLYSLIMLLGTVLCAGLGIWQYQKSLRFESPVEAPVILKGQFINHETVFLDNKSLNGKPGYAVITPFQTYDKVYLVNRGFIAYQSRDDKPGVNPIFGDQTLVGKKQKYELPVLLNTNLEDPIKNRVQFLDIKLFESRFESEVSEFVFEQQYGEGMLAAFPKTEPYISEHRHLGYAIQWWLLSGIAVVIWLLSSLKKRAEEGGKPC